MLQEKYENISVYSFEYEDNIITTMIDLQQDPLPNKMDAEDIIADVTWYLSEINEVVDTNNFYVTSMLITDMDDGELIHWLTDRWDPVSEEYSMDEKAAFNMLE